MIGGQPPPGHTEQQSSSVDAESSGGLGGETTHLTGLLISSRWVGMWLRRQNNVSKKSDRPARPPALLLTLSLPLPSATLYRHLIPRLTIPKLRKRRQANIKSLGFDPASEWRLPLEVSQVACRLVCRFLFLAIQLLINLSSPPSSLRIPLASSPGLHPITTHTHPRKYYRFLHIHSDHSST
jgi:hypothetical protein